MAQVHANARARVFNYSESDDAMAPLPPPPRPQARPSVRGVPVATAPQAAVHRRTRTHPSNFTDEDVGAPQPAPVPHAHPLAALSGNTDPSHGSASHGLRGKRLNPAFFNRERVAAFIDKENAAATTATADRDEDGDERATAHSTQQRHHAPPSSFMDSHTLHSTRILASRMQDIAAESTQIPELLEEEKIFAATDASHWRHELHPLPVMTALDSANDSNTSLRQQDSALERARVRKVKKQVDSKWLHAQRDASNRPRAPLERAEELHLREELLQTTVDELLSSGVLFDDDDDARRMAAFPLVQKPSLPIYSSGTTGLPGCCYDAWSY